MVAIRNFIEGRKAEQEAQKEAEQVWLDGFACHMKMQKLVYARHDASAPLLD